MVGEVDRSGGPADVLVAHELRKSYGPRHALQGLTFSLKAGRILGFLGPNGAGKTTSIRILTTMLEPESGHFVVDGITSDRPSMIRRRIGVLPEGLGFPKHMTGLEYLIFFGQLNGWATADAKAQAIRLLEDVGMQRRGGSLIGTYSHGMRQRIGIARALVNDPVVVFLDEPTLGLDPLGQEELLDLIQRIARERQTGIVLCSHLLSEIENVCDDVIILNDGRIVAQGTVAEVIGGDQAPARQGTALRVRVPRDAVGRAAKAVEAALPGQVRIELIGEAGGGWLRIELVDPVADEESRARLIN
ncbi:MAG TPA: ABC transporter ATP-binding protein, partial [Gaiellales bacterium]|nr:ABC transporter ATP-binding protein [Gaiellales bacterium]